VEEQGRWVARAFANRAPVFRLEDLERHEALGPLDQDAGPGAHEVLVEAPEHRLIHECPPERSRAALALARSRLADLAQDRRFLQLIWFRNQGPLAGASEPHPHAQVMGLPYLPAGWREEQERAEAHFQRTRRKLLTDLLRFEWAEGARVLRQRAEATLFVPAAPGAEFELWVVPHDHQAWLPASEPQVVAQAADLLRLGQIALARALGAHDQQAILVQASQSSPSQGQAWYLRLSPRLSAPGGFERATGDAVLSVPPELAAARLRAALPEADG
jgi:UDPglucose--hexose-1-phosphate uridylyltransferase